MASKAPGGTHPAGGSDVNAQIIAVLAEGALSTKQIANELGLNARSVYSRCKRLEEKGLLRSKLVAGRGPMYCVDEDEVVDRSKYEHCKQEEHELRPIDTTERVWSLP